VYGTYMAQEGTIVFKGGGFNEDTGNIDMVVDSVDAKPGDVISFEPDFFANPRLFGKGREYSPLVGELRRLTTAVQALKPGVVTNVSNVGTMLNAQEKSE
jgi:hypothetical protein